MKKLKKIFPFGFQELPNDRTGLASIFYSAGRPGVMTGGAMGGRKFPNIYQDQFNAALAAGKDPNEIMPWGGQGKDPNEIMPSGGQGKDRSATVDPVKERQQIQWAFPQYSQTWAFTPPVAPPHIMPPPFDKKKYK